MRILVVDDEDQILQLVTSMLELEGHEVETASHGVEALLRVENDRPDAILLDIVLPQMDGATVAQKLREDPETADIPIVFLTGLVDSDEVRRRGPIIGGQYFLAKPFDAKRLHEVLALATTKAE
jgi:CheY-like chemotaxis protein